ncbi:hypothetical protein MHEL_11120 [Mycolicibacterium helvum]|uniref:Uncharacterized protein n=1 Tax=Mycolicibacterium helvum TaxID=1534349 RepID=A0A7I7T329_9MYCO|nr:hypothetical protein MHEL_11120 [Mycolicibacterium helvum]
MMMPPLGCAAVPLPKKKLTSVWRPPPTPTAADLGVLLADATAAAGTGGAELSEDAAGVALVVTVLSCTAVFLVPREGRTGLDELGFFLAGPAWAFDFGDSPDDELLDADDPFEAAEPVESAAATAGTEAIAAPTPSATAEAPIQVSTRRCPGADCFGAAMPPNSAGNIRSSWTSDANRSVELIWATPRCSHSLIDGRLTET